MQQLVVRISSQQKSLIQQLAHREDTTLSELVRSALDHYIQASSKQKKYNVLEELATTADSTQGPTDLSSTYKDQLY